MPSTTTPTTDRLPEPPAPVGYSWTDRKRHGFGQMEPADADALGVSAYRDAWQAAAAVAAEAGAARHAAVLALRAVESDDYATDVERIEARRTLADAERVASSAARAADAAARRFDLAYLAADGRHAHYAAQVLRLDEETREAAERFLSARAARDRYLSSLGLGSHGETWSRGRRYGAQTLLTEVKAAAGLSGPAFSRPIVEAIAEGASPQGAAADHDAERRRVRLANSPSLARLGAAGREVGR